DIPNIINFYEYGFLQDNLNGTNKSLTYKKLAVFYRKMVDIMIPYYQSKQVTAGDNEFFQMYEQLDENQLKEKAFLAYDFFLADVKDTNYPFKYSIKKSEGEVSCGRNYGHFQSKNRSRIMEKMEETEFENPIFSDFLHLYPFGDAEGEITKRIYINTTPENATQIALELFKKCAEYPDDKNYRPYVKFFTKDNRNDTMLAYCTEKNFDIMFDLVHEIFMEHKEWFNGTGKLPLTAQIFDENKREHVVLGIADEPTVSGTSFHKLFCDEVICPFKIDLKEKLGIKDLGELPNDVIDKYVTYDNLKPYIEKTCYSADYPFLTKETVKNKKQQTEKTIADNKAPAEDMQNPFESLHDNNLAKELIDMGLR
ncbi:MAG: hypothetical protein KIG16_01515, partial [Eubacteriales bacterium]|nr:hypothetical protein [Eubacteriales bacterium]